MSSTQKSTLWIAGAILLVSGLALAGTEKSKTEAIAEGDIGLAKGSVFDVLTPAPVVKNTSEPGDGNVLRRGFLGAPPAIPHAIEDLLPITLTDNLCVDCHLIDEADEGDPTPIPESHYIDLRNAPEKVGDGLAGARHICVACHVEQTGAKPLVANPPRATP